MKEDFENGEKALIKKIILKQIMGAKSVYKSQTDKYGISTWIVTTENDTKMKVSYGYPEGRGNGVAVIVQDPRTGSDRQVYGSDEKDIFEKQLESTAQALRSQQGRETDMFTLKYLQDLFKEKQ